MHNYLIFKGIHKVIFSLALIMAMQACATVPLTGRRQLSLVDESAIQQEAGLAYQQFLSDPSTKIVKNTSDAQLVQRVGQRIAQAVNGFLKDNGFADEYDFNWEFNLVDENQINAWCMPGGKVAIYSGILPVTRNEAGLATVMGHEIAHAIAKHASERMSQTIAAQLGGAAVDVATAERSSTTRAVLNTAYGLGGQLALLSYSRNQESEADRLGLVFMALAGYDPTEAIGFWERMMEAKGAAGGAPPEFLSTHPSDVRRINDIKKLLPEALGYYNKG